MLVPLFSLNPLDLGRALTCVFNLIIISVINNLVSFQTLIILSLYQLNLSCFPFISFSIPFCCSFMCYDGNYVRGGVGSNVILIWELLFLPSLSPHAAISAQHVAFASHPVRFSFHPAAPASQLILFRGFLFLFTKGNVFLNQIKYDKSSSKFFLVPVINSVQRSALPFAFRILFLFIFATGWFRWVPFFIFFPCFPKIMRKKIPRFCIYK